MGEYLILKGEFVEVNVSQWIMKYNSRMVPCIRCGIFNPGNGNNL
jgi:hypothetical protein